MQNNKTFIFIEWSQKKGVDNSSGGGGGFYKMRQFN